jgi:nicotinate-nucleotide adenylyltransferase
VGADTFATLPTWKRWQELFALAHIVLVARPGVDADAALAPELADALAARRTGDPGLLSRGAGRIYRQVVTQPISATRSASGARPPADYRDGAACRHRIY